MSFSPRIGWVIALDCEGRPIRELFGLEQVPTRGPYPLYRTACETHWMVRCGIGRNHAAAATMYLHQKMGGGAHIAWLNVGIAGHESLPQGTARRVNQIIEASTGASFYPTQVFNSNLMGCRLVTVDQPQKTITDTALYDMEGSAFFSVASRLSSQELVMLIKCVSDHGAKDEEFPSRDSISRWIADLAVPITTAVEGLLALSTCEVERLAEPDLTEILAARHFSVTQTHQLRAVMRRWAALKLGKSVHDLLMPEDDARRVIARIKIHLNGVVTDWRQP
jgi:hypothetical protein